MSKSYVEDLIESAEDKKQEKWLRKGWIITARSVIDELEKRLKKLEKKLGGTK